MCYNEQAKGIFIMFQKSDVTKDDYLKEIQAQMATLDDCNANMLDVTPYLLKHETKKNITRKSDKQVRPN